MKSFALALVAVLTLASCASLPEPQALEGQGLAILALDYTNDSNRTESIYQIDLLFSDGTTQRTEPKAGWIVLAGTDPTLSLVGARFSTHNGWTGSSWEVPVQIALPFEPGTVFYLPYVLEYEQSVQAGPRTTWSANARWRHLWNHEVEALQARVRADQNFPLWTERSPE